MQSSNTTKKEEIKVRIVSKLPADVVPVLSSEPIFHCVYQYDDAQLAGEGVKPSLLSSSKVAD
jgi:hypothetical protein